MEGRAFLACPGMDTAAALIVLLPMLRVAAHNIDARWPMTWLLALFVPTYVVIFNRFSCPRANASEHKTNKKTSQKSGKLPRAWAGVIELYLFILKQRSLECYTSSIYHRANLAQISYVGNTSIGIDVPEPQKWQFFINGLCWTQRVILEDKRRVVIYNLLENTIYQVKMVNDGHERPQTFKICTKSDEPDAKVLELFRNSLTADEPLKQGPISLAKTPAPNYNQPSPALLHNSAKSSVAPTPISSQHEDILPPYTAVETDNNEGDNQNSAANDHIPEYQWNYQSEIYTECPPKFLPVTFGKNNDASLLDSENSLSHVSLSEDALSRPRRRFDIKEEAISAASQLLDLKKMQCRKVRKENAKKLANLRTEIESLNVKLTTKLRSSERTRKRIQVLRERVELHRHELENLTETKSVKHRSDVEILASKARMTEEDLLSKTQGHNDNVRQWEEQKRIKQSEISKLEQRCAKLSDRLEKALHERKTRPEGDSKEIDAYIDQIRTERNNKKLRCVRLESDFNEAIHKLENK